MITYIVQHIMQKVKPIISNWLDVIVFLIHQTNLICYDKIVDLCR